jgi:phospholipid/cholesterol/gamma-HCH transport system substrate-binding protein
MARQQFSRLIALAAIAVAAIAIAVILVTGGSSYTLHAEFTDAGQLVSGDLVTVGGHPVGSVSGMSLTRNGLADVTLSISDGSITPLRQGTVAQIGQLSLTGESNRFVSLLPGGGAPIPSGGTLPPAETRGIVDLDTLLDSLTPRVRASLQKIIRTGAYLLSGQTARQANDAFAYLNPAFSQTRALGSEIVADRFSLQRLVASTAQVSSSLAAHDSALAGAVSNTAAVLREIAAERAALQDLLVRAPGVLHQSSGVLADVNYSLHALNPTLRDLQPLAPKLATLLRKLVPAARDAIPTITDVQALVAPAERVLTELPPVVRKAVPAINSLRRALPPLTPILSGLRPYAPEVVSGFFGGVGGYSGGYYDANGQFLRTGLELGPGSFSGLLSILNAIQNQLPAFNGTRFSQLQPCPGGATDASPNGGNPWNHPDSAIPVCKPNNNQ